MGGQQHLERRRVRRVLDGERQGSPEGRSSEVYNAAHFTTAAERPRETGSLNLWTAPVPVQLDPTGTRGRDDVRTATAILIPEERVRQDSQATPSAPAPARWSVR